MAEPAESVANTPPTTERTALLRGEPRPRLASRSSSEVFPVPSDVEELEQNGSPKIGTVQACCIIAAFVVLIFLQASNMTLMSTIQGLVADDLNAYSEVSWFTSSYLIGQSCMSPVYGRLSQIFSTRNLVLCSSILFAAGSLVASMAPNLAVFLLGRSIQGSGAAGVMSLSVILVIQLAPLAHRGLFLGLTNTAITAGVSLGAVFGGSLGWSIGWRALMWLQTPLSTTAGIFIFLTLGSSVDGKSPSKDDNQTTKQKLWSFDYTGSFLLIVCLVSLLIGLSKPADAKIPFFLAVVLLIAFILNELYRAAVPVIPISVLKSRGVLLSSFSQLAFMTARWTVLFYTPIYMIAVQEWKPGSAGAMLIPTNSGFAIGGLLVGALHIRRAGSFYVPATICFFLFPLTMFAFYPISTAESPVWIFTVNIFLNGLIVGAALNYCLAHVLYLVHPEHKFVATSLLATFRGFSGSFGSAVGGGLFYRVLKSSLEHGFAEAGLDGKDDLIRRLLGKPVLVRSLTGIDESVAVRGYEDAIRQLFIAAGVLGVVAIIIQAGTGWNCPKESDAKADDEDA